MPELVAHEVQVAVSGSGGGHETNHLMKGYSPVYQEVLRPLVHAPVHLLVDQAEDDGLVAHQGLVVTLRVGNGLFVRTLVGEFVPYFPRAPLLVALFLYPLYPVVGDSHGHAEVESHAALSERCGKAGHSADVFGYRDSVWIQLVDEPVGEGQIDDGVVVHAAAEVDFVIAEIRPQAVVAVKHAGHPVETESVQMIFLHPELAVAQEEVQYLVLAVVEAAAPPCGMIPRGSGVEVEVFPAVETAESFDFVGNRMGMDYVHDYGDAHPVGLVHQGLEFLRSAEAGAQGVEIAHLIAERAVVGMLLERHDLQGVIAQSLHPREHGLAEIVETRHLLLFAAHSDVAFVDEGMLPLSGPPVLPFVLFLRIPYLGAEDLARRILHHPGDIGRKTFPRPSGPFYPELVQLSVTQEHARNCDLPVTAAHGLEPVGIGAFPVVEIADKIHPGGVRSPFTEYPVSPVGLVEAVEELVVGRIRNGLSAHVRDEFRSSRIYAGVARIYHPLERFKPGVELIYHLFVHIRSVIHFQRSLCFRGHPADIRGSP